MDYDKRSAPEEVILQFKDIGSVNLRLGVHPVQEAHAEAQAIKVLAEAITDIEDGSSEWKEKHQRVQDRLRKLDKEMPNSGKSIGIPFEGWALRVVRLAVYA